MMLPVSVMKVMPTATQPMNEMALSNALMLICEVKPGVVSAKIAMRSRRRCGSPARRCRACVPRGETDARSGVRSCRRDRMGDVGQHAMHARLTAAIGGDLPAAIHADDDVGHAEHLLDVGRRHDQAIAAIAELPDQAGRFPPARRRRRRGSARSSSSTPGSSPPIERPNASFCWLPPLNSSAWRAQSRAVDADGGGKPASPWREAAVARGRRAACDRRAASRPDLRRRSGGETCLRRRDPRK